MFNKLTMSVMVLSLCLLANSADASEQKRKNLVKNGDFSKTTDTGGILFWKGSKKAKIEKINGKHTLVLEGANIATVQEIALKPEWVKIKLKMKMRTIDVNKGDASWKNGRLAMCFKDADGKRAGKWPNVFNATGTTAWKTCKREYEVPKGAVLLELTLANFGVSGRVEFQNIKISVSAKK